MKLETTNKLQAEACTSGIGSKVQVHRKSPSGAVVMGADYRALGLVRSLGQHGIPVIVLKRGDQLIAASSRYVTQTVLWPAEGGDMDLEFLLRLADEKSLSGWLLVPTDDETVGLVARAYHALAKEYIVMTPAWEQLRSVCDKRLLSQLARNLNLDGPWTFCPTSCEDLELIDCPFPVIIKPALREVGNPLTIDKAWRADTRQQLLARFSEACSFMRPDQLIIQEFVPGYGEAQFSYAALCSEGRVLASVVARRTRQFPMDFGRASTFVETVDEPGVVQPAMRLLSAVAMTGLAEVEFKRDPSGRFRLLDVNPRIWGWHTLCRRAGVDFSYLLWLLAQNEPVPSVQAQPGIGWMRLSMDLPIAIQEIAHGRLSVITYLRSFLRPLDSAIFDADDPIPGLLELPLLVHLVASRVLRNARYRHRRYRK